LFYSPKIGGKSSQIQLFRSRLSILGQPPRVSQMKKTVLNISDCDTSHLISLLNKYQLKLHIKPDDLEIPGSYWGESEAGLISNNIYVRNDTPIHSMLHETCHYICMDNSRRQNLDTDAAGDYDEENGVCYLQIILAELIPEMGKQRMMQDMDSWGYTFRLGSAQKWFEQDAEDAFNWLINHQIINAEKQATFKLRL